MKTVTLKCKACELYWSWVIDTTKQPKCPKCTSKEYPVIVD